MNKFCREPEHRISITDSSISSFPFLAKIFYQFGATKSKPGRPSLQMSVIQHDPQRSSRKSESFKRTVEHPFLAGEVPRRAQGSPSQMPWKEQGPATSKAGGHCWAPNLYSQGGDAPHRAFRQASAEVTSPTLYLFLDSPPERAIPSTRTTDKAALPVTAHRRGSPSHPTREQSDFACCSHRKKDVTAVCKYTGRGRNLGSKRNALCYH